MSAIRTVVRFIKAGVHEEGEAAAEGTHAEEEESTPQIGRVTAFLIDYSWHCHFATGALQLYRVIEVMSPKYLHFYTWGGAT